MFRTGRSSGSPFIRTGLPDVRVSGQKRSVEMLGITAAGPRPIGTAFPLNVRLRTTYALDFDLIVCAEEGAVNAF